MFPKRKPVTTINRMFPFVGWCALNRIFTITSAFFSLYFTIRIVIVYLPAAAMEQYTASLGLSQSTLFCQQYISTDNTNISHVL